VELRDKTNGIIILIHHLTKEVDSKWNKETGYEPKLAHIRGSKRLVDCPNQIILLHRPDFYSDLVAEDASCVGLFLAFLEVNRDGKTGVIKYQHQIDYSIFTELE
jgi:replicative DNA helicase